AEAKARADAEAKAAAARKDLADLLAREAKERAAQQQVTAAALSAYQSLLVNHVEPRYQPPPACPEGGVADISIKLSPGGEVVSASVRRSSGNAVCDGAALAALKRASPLPLPRDPVLAERLQQESFVFKFKVAE
ncbi:MAG TPA: cell envelope integrity protein TolA, partial [Plasticicumulans sp.]|nr:cell envelope integrity protein TolA [Plasticicumulans sp.]HNF66047.1 cell envelope integrity protein TolA [Plasticicumulans sp.]HNJ07762.1 cell envelope integrity protein TolA [Plasticicumulans sp.]